MISKQGHQDFTLRIREALPPTCQVALFSATYSDEIAAFSRQVVPEPLVRVFLKPEKLSLDNLKQFRINCTSVEEKNMIVSKILSTISVGQTIVFVKTRKGSERLFNLLNEEGHTVYLLHGAMEPNDRDFVMTQFRKGIARVLISTDLLSRGVDVLQVTLVVNYNLPILRNGSADNETYLHRIGRTGRFGNSGVAINLIEDSHSEQVMDSIQSHFKNPVEPLNKEDLEELGEMLADLE
eukprot:TRINITY_DN6253_c0_g1_i2.p1 TRINITY_DN6253_c0_g1~~TRINITY_DN6253_c0_g1_i2.p1  ORF type:complete len:238 (-),score=51.84 TRINITY_DN6253_c0_g1_i2:9-722(-)